MGGYLTVKNDAIEKIKSAEAEALEKTDKAKAEAADMISAAKAEQAETLARARRLADEKTVKEKNSSKDAAEELIRKAEAEAKAEAKELSDAAEQKMPGAVSLVLMEIFKKWQ